MKAGFVRHGLRFGLAGPEDAAAVSELLGLSMPGWVELSMESGPDHLTPLHPGARHTVMLARRDGDGAPAGMVSRTDLPSFVDGAPALVAWLGQWRIAPAWRGRPALLRAGFAAARLLDGETPPSCYLAAIVADNAPARRLLEAGLRGFPEATRLFGLRTLAIPARRARTHDVRLAEAGDMPAIVAFLDGENRQRALAPRMDDGSDLAAGRWPGLRPSDFLVMGASGAITGAAALWDQAPHRRVVVRGYHARLAAMRGLLNLAAPITGLPRLPPAGAALDAAFFAFLTVRDGDEEAAISLLRTGLDLAARRGLALVSLGLADDDPLLRIVSRAFRHRSYASDIYRIAWPDNATATLDIDRPKVEAALL